MKRLTFITLLLLVSSNIYAEKCDSVFKSYEASYNNALKEFKFGLVSALEKEDVYATGQILGLEYFDLYNSEDRPRYSEDVYDNVSHEFEYEILERIVEQKQELSKCDGIITAGLILPYQELASNLTCFAKYFNAQKEFDYFMEVLELAIKLDSEAVKSNKAFAVVGGHVTAEQILDALPSDAEHFGEVLASYLGSRDCLIDEKSLDFHRIKKYTLKETGFAGVQLAKNILSTLK